MSNRYLHFIGITEVYPVEVILGPMIAVISGRCIGLYQKESTGTTERLEAILIPI